MNFRGNICASESFLLLHNKLNQIYSNQINNTNFYDEYVMNFMIINFSENVM